MVSSWWLGTFQNGTSIERSLLCYQKFYGCIYTRKKNICSGQLKWLCVCFVVYFRLQHLFEPNQTLTHIFPENKEKKLLVERKTESDFRLFLVDVYRRRKNRIDINKRECAFVCVRVCLSMYYSPGFIFSSVQSTQCWCCVRIGSIGWHIHKQQLFLLCVDSPSNKRTDSVLLHWLNLKTTENKFCTVNSHIWIKA